MKRGTKTVAYDDTLKLEAYRFEGIVQSFPSHFHEHYVIGFVEAGRRALFCRNREYVIEKGGIVLFNPGDSHACAQSDAGIFDFSGLNISRERMLELAEEVSGRRELPGFSKNVIYDGEAVRYLRRLHEMVMKGFDDLGKEETLLFLLSLLVQNYGQPFSRCVPKCRQEIEKACAYIREHFIESMNLEQICLHVGLSKSTLLRAFTKEKGVTPYRYLETVRINEAKKLLSGGTPPVEAAMRTGFSDQSHFTNYFSQFIGLTPGSYREIFSERDGA